MLARRKPPKSGIERAPRREWPSHRKWVRGFACAICGLVGHECSGKIECAHVRTGTDGGTSIKPSDWWTIPMCEEAHKLQHQIGESAFERRYSIIMKKIAIDLARRSPDIEMRKAMKEAGL